MDVQSVPIFLVICDRYSAYKSLARQLDFIILAFYWAHVRRDFLDAEKKYPDLEKWVVLWAEKIGELYHINNLRCKEFDQKLPLQWQTPAKVDPLLEVKHLEEIFRYKIFKILLKKEKITEQPVQMVTGWRHSGFNVFCGSRIQPGSEDAMENLARYIIRASFSQERMTYIPEESKVIYQSKDGKEEKVFDALEWLAAMCSYVPNARHMVVHFYLTHKSIFSMLVAEKRNVLSPHPEQLCWPHDDLAW